MIVTIVVRSTFNSSPPKKCKHILSGEHDLHYLKKIHVGLRNELMATF